MPKFQVPAAPETYSKRLGDEIRFSGMNLRDADTAIGEGQSPYMKNITLDDGGKPTKRRGQTWLMEVDIEDTPIRGYYEELFAGRHVFAGSENLYSYDEETGTLTELMTGLSNKEGFFYVFNDVLYYKNGAEFISVSSTFTAQDVIEDGLGYIPTIVINKNPDGTGGTTYEQRNLIQPKFTETFKGDGTTEYYLSYGDLDEEPVTVRVVIDNVWTDYTEDTDFTVDRELGKITFNVAPAESDAVANVSITASKTEEGYADRIVKATRVTLYGGGTNDSRIFCCGNEDYKNVYWHTGLTGNTNNDALYYPEFGFNRIGSDAKMISGWSYLYSLLIALKEDGIYKITYSLVNGLATFPAAILNRQIGCDMPGSIQIIKNFPVFGNTQSGLWTIVNVLASDTEKNVEPISALINKPPIQISDIKGLLEESETDLKAATSFDDGHKYYLCIGDHCWVWDYDRRPYSAGNQDSLIWYYWTNIAAGHWHYSGREAYYSHRTTGNIVKFQDNLNDFGEPIDGRYRIKRFNFDRPERLKDIPSVWITTRAAADVTIDVTYLNDSGGEQMETLVVPASSVASFDWDNWDWDNFTWDVQQYAPTLKTRPKVKKTNYFSMEYRNNKVNENLSLLNIVIFYNFSAYVK
jgi:hypothetical protein